MSLPLKKRSRYLPGDVGFVLPHIELVAKGQFAQERFEASDRRPCSLLSCARLFVCQYILDQ